MAKIIKVQGISIEPSSRFQTRRASNGYGLIVIDSKAELQYSISCNSYLELDVMAHWEDAQWLEWLKKHQGE